MGSKLQVVATDIGADGLDRVCRVGWGWVVLIAAALAYASLIPFDFAVRSLAGSGAWHFPRLGLPAPGVEDLLTNLAVYLPIGFIVTLMKRHCRRTIAARIALAVAVGALISVAVELAQALIVSRVASWFDVVLNITGAATGASLAVAFAGPLAAWLDRVRRHIARRPFGFVAAVVTLGLLLFNLAPFDFVTDTTGLWESFSKSRWDVAISGAASAAAPLAPLVDRVYGAAWLAVLGYALVLAAREIGHGKRDAPALALMQGAALIGAVTVLQLFMPSRPFDMGRVLLSGAGVVAGVWTAVFVVDALGERAWRDGRGLVVPTPILLGAAVFQIAALWLSPLGKAVRVTAPDPSRIEWLPFRVLWQGSMIDAVCTAALAIAVYGVLALTVGTLLRRLGVTRVWLITTCITAGAAVVRLGVESATTAPVVDATMLVLAVTAVVLAAGAERWIPLPRMPRV